MCTLVGVRNCESNLTPTLRTGDRSAAGECRPLVRVELVHGDGHEQIRRDHFERQDTLVDLVGVLHQELERGRAGDDGLQVELGIGEQAGDLEDVVDGCGVQLLGGLRDVVGDGAAGGDVLTEQVACDLADHVDADADIEQVVHDERLQLCFVFVEFGGGVGHVVSFGPHLADAKQPLRLPTYNLLFVLDEILLFLGTKNNKISPNTATTYQKTPLEQKLNKR